MKMCILIGLLTLATVCTSKIVYMTEVFRHGARYPINDLYDGNETKEFHGQLTTVGLREQYLLGNYIHADYALKGVDGKLFNATLKPREVEVFSDDSGRCVDSAYAHVLGLFPFDEGEQIQADFNPQLLEPPFKSFLTANLKKEDISESIDFALMHGYQPVPIRVDTEFFPKCANEALIYAKRVQEVAKELAELQLQQSLFTEKMRLVFNLTTEASNLVGLAELADTLICDKYLGRPMPKQFTDDDYEEILYIQHYLMTILNGGHAAKVFSTPFIRKLISNLKSASEQKLDAKKLSLFSEHDVNLAPLMNLYNLTSPQCLKKLRKNETVEGNCAKELPFASNMLFELHQEDSIEESMGQQSNEGFYVKIRYNGEYYNVCGNSQKCPLNEFISRSEQILVDFDRECGNHLSASESKQGQQRIVVLDS